MRRALGQVFQGSEYRWIERQHFTSWLVQQWDKLMAWLDKISGRYPTGFNIGLALLVVVTVVLFVHIGYVLVRIVTSGSGPGVKVAPAAPSPPKDARAYLALADRLAEQGRYVEALGHLFLAVVLELDGRKALRFHASKTPAEYAAEARLDSSGRASLASLVAQLYRHLFGAVPCDAREYAAFGAAAQDLLRGRHVAPA